MKHQLPYHLPPLTLNWDDAQADNETKAQFFEEHLAYDPELDVLHVRFSYDLIIGMEEINRPIHLLKWVDYLSGQPWFRIEFISPFIEKVCWIKDWSLCKAR